MTATNMCSNFGGKWDSPPFLLGWSKYQNKITYFIFSLNHFTVMIMFLGSLFSLFILLGNVSDNLHICSHNFYVFSHDHFTLYFFSFPEPH